MVAETEYDPANIKIRNYEVTYKPAPKKMANVFEMLSSAKRPLIMTGGGVILGKASALLTQLARKYQIPVTGTLMGLGSFPGTDPLWLGMLGMHGTYYANMAISHCDLLIAVGVRFDDRVTGTIETFAANAKIVQIDIDPSSINKNVTVDLADNRRHQSCTQRTFCDSWKNTTMRRIRQHARNGLVKLPSGKKSTTDVLSERQGHQTAICNRNSVQTYNRRRDHHDGSRSKSDVDGAVFPF